MIISLNPVDIIEQVRHMYQYKISHTKNSSFDILVNIAWKKQYQERKEKPNT